MNATTKDGHSVTNIVQVGPCSGIESKRVYVRRADGCGYDFWECETIDEARIFVGNSRRFTREQLVSDLSS